MLRTLRQAAKFERPIYLREPGSGEFTVQPSAQLRRTGPDGPDRNAFGWNV